MGRGSVWIGVGVRVAEGSLGLIEISGFTEGLAGVVEGAAAAENPAQADRINTNEIANTINIRFLFISSPFEM